MFHLQLTVFPPAHPLQVDVIGQFHVFGVDLQDLQPTCRIWDSNVNLTVKPAWRGHTVSVSISLCAHGMIVGVTTGACGCPHQSVSERGPHCSAGLSLPWQPHGPFASSHPSGSEAVTLYASPLHRASAQRHTHHHTKNRGKKIVQFQAQVWTCSLLLTFSLLGAMASSSSMKMMAGALFSASSNAFLRLLSDSPASLLMISGPAHRVMLNTSCTEPQIGELMYLFIIPIRLQSPSLLGSNYQYWIKRRFYHWWGRRRHQFHWLQLGPPRSSLYLQDRTGGCLWGAESHQKRSVMLE